MEWFYHPDFSVAVIRRRAAAVMIDLLADAGEYLTTRGRSVLFKGLHSSQTAYRMARHRLLKAGVLACRRSEGRPPVLMLTAEGTCRVTAALRPTPYWEQRWSGRWCVLAYDVPEKQNSYRRTLQQHLHHLRLGCLQGSVWISPRDIRPDFADLAEAGGLDEYGVLFDARTVLGLSGKMLAERAWNFSRLRERQAWYLQAAQECLKHWPMRRAPLRGEVLLQEEQAAYLWVMAGDPLLPKALWPDGYLGRDAYHLHGEVFRMIASTM